MSLSRHELLHSPEFVEPPSSEATLESIRAQLTGHLTHCIEMCESEGGLAYLEPAFRRYLKKVTNAPTLERIGNLGAAITEFLDRSGLS